MSTAPLVSIYLPTRNRAHCLVEAVESVLAQTFADFELLVVDDGSIDDTPRILADLAKRDSRVRVFRHDAAQGAPAARNMAIVEAHGKFITGLDDDDLMLPNRLRNLLSAWSGRASLVCSAFWREREGRRRKLNGSGRIITLSDLLHYNLVGNQILTLTDSMRAVGGFDCDFVASQDYDLWTRLVARFGPAVRIPAADYVVREGLVGPSISGSRQFHAGAVQFTAKHRPLMAAVHLRSQALVHKITAGERLGLLDVPKCLAWPSAGLFFKYWLRGHFEAFR